MMIYTSGTTGPPKGALEPHRVLLGHLPGVEFVHEFFPQAGDCLWTPADWAWAGRFAQRAAARALLRRAGGGAAVQRFDPEEAFALMAATGVRNAFIPPTALRMLRARHIRSGATGSRCARSAPAVSRSAHRPTSGASRRSGSSSTSSMGKPSATRFSRPAARSAFQNRAPSASRCQDTRSRSSDPTERCARPANQVRSR